MAIPFVSGRRVAVVLGGVNRYLGRTSVP